MSVDATTLLFEGFLQKRKDTLKLRWVTYWFRLQNTTLFFYTQKNGCAAHLRGHYYMYTVQSVREVHRVDGKRFLFEIIMTNGKRKMLAAETAALRKEWVGLLWQAMNLLTSGVTDSRRAPLDVCERRERLSGSPPAPSHGAMEALPARRFSAPSVHIQHATSGVSSSSLPWRRRSEEPNHEEAASTNTPPESSAPHHNGHSVDSPQGPERAGGSSRAEDTPEGAYDILPRRNEVCESSASTEKGEGEYDVPLSYRRAVEHPNPTESIYEVPNSLLRSMPDPTLEEQLEHGVVWRI